jgi:hypothetical protein
LESYGYKTIRLNKFNIGNDQSQTISGLIRQVLSEFDEAGDNLIKQVLEDSVAAHEGILTGTYKHCKRCDQNKPKDQFERPGTTRGYGRYCNDCVAPSKSTKQRKKKRNKQASGKKMCSNCKQTLDKIELLDRTTTSGKRRLWGSCKRLSVQNQRDNSAFYMRRSRQW